MKHHSVIGRAHMPLSAVCKHIRPRCMSRSAYMYVCEKDRTDAANAFSVVDLGIVRWVRTNNPLAAEILIYRLTLLFSNILIQELAAVSLLAL